MKHVSWACAALLALGACTKASESTDAKRTPKPPPAPASAENSAAISIAVEIDGAPAPLLDSAKLASTAPDFKDEEHRAWKLSTLLANTNRPGMAFAVSGDQGVTIVLRSPKNPGDPFPAAMLNRRGELFATLIDPAQPFPAYHGQGGRLARPGDPSARIGGVTKIRAYVEMDSGTASK